MKSVSHEAPSTAMFLAGRNLGERQKDLNSKVNDAVVRQVDFEDIKNLPEVSDIDKLFKIDVASKYKNMEYIVEILKSGDDLHISRALRSKWLYDEEFSNVINPNYLKELVFPYMSYKMQRKMLTALSVHIRDPDRLESFLNYCIKTQLYHIEFKFLHLLSEESRLNYLNKLDIFDLKLLATKKTLEHVIGNSFVLAEAYLKKVEKCNKDKILYRLRYLYSVSEQQYLCLLEKYSEMDTSLKFGLKISKNVAIKYKNRILAHPLLYSQKLDTSTLIKHSTTEEVKLYAQALLPDVGMFWNGKYCKTHSQILGAIPSEERFEFVKSIFTDKFPGEEFETCKEFYTSDSYLIMTGEQKQEWALQNMDQKKCVSKKESHLVWYKYLPFEKAFTLLKEEYVKCKKSSKKSKLIEFLIETCKSQEDLQKLFEFYYEIMDTEDSKCKIDFVMKVQQFHKVYEFRGKCWDFFQKVLLDDDIIKLSKSNLKLESTAMTVFLYHIIHNKEMPSKLDNFIENNNYFPEKDYNLTKSQQQKVYEYLIEQHVRFLKDLDESNTDSARRTKRCINAILDLMEYNKKTEEDIPEIVQKYVKLYWEEFREYPIFDVKNKDPYKTLKKDVGLVNPLESIKIFLAAMDKHCRIAKFLKKLRVYFPFDDVTKEILKLLHDYLIRSLHKPQPDHRCRKKTTLFCVAGICLLSNKKELNNFLMTYIPTSGKIRDWRDYEPSVLIQQAICAHAHLARPLPDPEALIKYVKGDYAQGCSSTLIAYVANLPSKMVNPFLERLIQSPDKKAQKQGMKLTFVYTPDFLMKQIFLYVWGTTNKSKIRKKLYESMSRSLMYETGEDQIKMYKDFLRPMTLGLNMDELIKKIGILRTDVEDLPNGIKGIHLLTVWEVSRKLGNTYKMSCVLQDIVQEISCMEKVAMDNMVSEFIQGALDADKIGVIAAYLVFYTKNEDINKTREMAIATTTKLIDLHFRGTPVEKVMIWKFLSQLAEHNYDINIPEYSTTNEIITDILNQILNSIPFENISYVSFWETKLAIIWNNVMDLGNHMVTKKELDGKSITKELMKNYATQVNIIIEDLSATGHYFKMYEAKIAEKIANNVDVLKLRRYEDMNWLHFLIFLAESLVDFMKEGTVMLGLYILPNECALPKCALDYGKLLEKIDCFDNAEVQKFLKKKFYEKAKRRRIISSDEDE